MIRPLDRHLDEAELDALVAFQTLGGVAGSISEDAIGEAQRHLVSCEDCDRKVQMHRSAQTIISLRMVIGEEAKRSNCPDETEWIPIAAGLVEEIEAKERMNHAAQCGYCGPLLKAAARSLSDATTPDEEITLTKLRSAQPDWQAQMARRLGSAVEPQLPQDVALSFSKILSYWPRFAFASAVLAIFLATVWIVTHWPASAEELLAQAYTERRTIEVRIPGAKYAPLRVERSGPGSDFDKPEPLLKAEALISGKLRQIPNDPEWLQAKARADILDGNYESAINVLTQILDVHPDSSPVMVDLASAYYRRASSNTDREDYGIAVNYLREALSKTPDDPVALFNLAICEERYDLYDPAKSDWQKYLAIDPGSLWSEEARRNLSRVEEEIRKKETSLRRPLLGVDDFISLPSQYDRILEMDDHVEDYLHLAISRWLPEAFPQSVPPSSVRPVDASFVVGVLAHVLSERHGDAWLADVLKQPHGDAFPAASAALASALRANDNGDYLEANQEAQRAARMFRSAGNNAAELRAKVEELYSDHLLYEGSKCVELANNLSIRLKQRNYEWLRAQTSLEQSNCAGLVGDQGVVSSAADRGTKEAAEHLYAALTLRGLGFKADSAASMGDVHDGISLASKALDKFWETDVDLMKGYNLYTDLDTAAETLHLPYLQVAIWQQATALVDLHTDVLQQAMAHRWFADAAYLANMPDLALVEFSKASERFAAAPQTVATIRGKLDAEIWQAALEVRKGDLQLAENRLETAQAELERHPSYIQEVSFYATLAELKLRRRDSVEAETALRAAVFLAEWGLRTCRSQDARHQWAERTATTYRDLVAWKLREGDNQGALELWEWYRGAEFRTENSDSPEALKDFDLISPPDVSGAPALPVPTTVAQQLPFLTRKTVVAFAVLPEGTAVWAYDEHGVSLHWINKPPSEIRELVSRLRELCSSSNTNLTVLNSVSRNLYDLLLGPIEDRIVPGRTLVFEPDDSLSNIPFEALVNSKGHYLSESAAVVTSPGLYRSLALRPPLPINTDTPSLVISVPAPPVPGIDPIPGAQDEGQSVASQFRFPQLFDGPAATFEAIHDALPTVQLFHFSGHASAGPNWNGLLLAEHIEGSTQVRVIGPESLTPTMVGNLQLAVLSACGTGAQLSADPSGTLSLSQAFLRSGVPDVVASRWNVDSEATALLMNEFYKYLLSGSEVSASLHSAQLRLASQPRFSHPYYWAAFGVQGL